jgi:hypothetical protein
MRALLIVLCLAAQAFAGGGEVLTYEWTGATSTDFNSNGNWTTNGVVCHVTVPASSDTVVINSGSVNITGSVDQSAKDFAAFVIGSDYSGQCGNSSSDPLKFGATKMVVAGGGATQYLGTGATYNWDTAVIGSVGPSGTDDCYISGTIPELVIHKGDVFITSGTITTMILDATDETVANVDVLVTTATVTTLHGRNGNAEFDAGTITTTNWDDGTLDVDGGTFTTINQRGGTVEWGTTGTLTTYVGFDGTFDASDDVRAKTITNATTYEGNIFNLANHIGNITVTNGVEVFGGYVQVADNETIQY